MTDAFAATAPSANNQPVTINTFESTIQQDVGFYTKRTTAQVLSTAGALGVGFLVGSVPGLLLAAGGMATAYAFGRIGRNLDMRERPLIGQSVAIARLGEKLVYRMGKKTGPRQVWRASEEEVRAYAAKDDTGAFALGLRHSLPVKMVYTYPRLLLAKLRDEATLLRGKIPGQSGVTFHEGVASRRLERAGMITPNPRTQQHIDLARKWRQEKGLTLR